MDIQKREDLICKDCVAPSTGGFKKVVALKKSGLLIYQHTGEESKNYDTLKEEEKNAADKSKQVKIFILHNDSEHDLKRPDYAFEMCQLRTKCFKCINLVKTVRSLLDELYFIGKNQVIGLCEHCKRHPGTCKRCQYIVNKFLENKMQLENERQEQLKSFLSKVNQFLLHLLNDENLDRSQMNSDPSTLELERLLRELKKSLDLRKRYETFLPTGQLSSLTAGTNMIDDLLTGIKLEDWGKPELEESLPPTCKKGMQLQPKKPQRIEKKKHSKDKSSHVSESSRNKGNKKESKISTNDDSKQKKSKALEEKAFDVSGNISYKSELRMKIDTNSSMWKKPIIKISVEANPNKNKDKVQMTRYNKDKNAKQTQNTKKLRGQADLSSRRIVGGDDDEDLFSFDTCVDSDQQGPDLITEMIKRTKIVKYAPHPNTFHNLSETAENDIIMLPNLGDAVKEIKKIKKKPSTSGVLYYKLSDKTFISKGYTILPEIKVMKRMDVYKMKPVNPHFNWFKRHKDDQIKNYDTGEILAVINENGTGKWFYKNGRIALDYYNAEDAIAGQRYVLYSSGEESLQDQGARLKKLKGNSQVLGVFDCLGNGAVYDLNGKERIKYNQTEGMIMDRKIGPIGRWKWHSINDPPVLKQRLKDNLISPLSFGDVDNRTEEQKQNERPQNPEVMQIVFQTYVKQNAEKMLQKFKPFQIRMKAFKINDEFSLRIIDQAHIYLLFRDGTMSMKLNLGFQLVVNEIVDSNEGELGEVTTQYDQVPVRTASVANIQKILLNTRKISESIRPCT